MLRRLLQTGAAAMTCAATAARYDELCTKLKKISHLEGSLSKHAACRGEEGGVQYQPLTGECAGPAGAMGLMGWDEQTFMPPGAEEARANQKAALAGVIHEAKVDPKIGELVNGLAVATDLDVAQQANVREAKEKYERNTRISTELASKMAQLESEGYGAWVRARESNDYDAFAPILSEILELRKQMLRLAKPEMPLYDAAVDDFDPRMQADRLTEIFDMVIAQRFFSLFPLLPFNPPCPLFCLSPSPLWQASERKLET